LEKHGPWDIKSACSQIFDDYGKYIAERL